MRRLNTLHRAAFTQEAGRGNNQWFEMQKAANIMKITLSLQQVKLQTQLSSGTDGFTILT